MRKILPIILLFIIPQLAFSQVWEIYPNNSYRQYFQEAYQQNPSIPKGILEAIAYNNTHIRHIAPQNEQASCVGMPQYYGVMGLIDDGKGYFRNSLHTVATLSGYSVEAIKNDPRINILAFAKAYTELIESYALRGAEIEEHIAIIDALSEIPSDKRRANDFAFESQVYAIFKNLTHKEFQQAYSLPNYQLDLPKIFGETNYKILSAGMVVVSPFGVEGEQGQRYNTGISRMAPPPCSDVSVSFPHPVIAAAADPSNYSSRLGVAITHVTIHTMQGSYAGSISWFQNPAANVSAHYNIRASDGQISQSVCEIDKAWHVSNSNPYAIGIEHEGYIDDASWYTNVMYTVSSNLTKDIAARRSINLKRTYDKNGDIGVKPISDGCFKIKGHQHFPSQTHVDPGQFWDWNRYYDLLNPVATATSNLFTACSGTFYDSGGSAGNYSNDERIFYRIEPIGATSVTLTFSSFNVELNYDYLYVYDGDSHNDSLLVVLTGSTIPAAITGKSGKLLLEFRTDCGTVASGWAANWTCSTAASSCGVPTNLMEVGLNLNNVRLDWDDVAGATAYQVRIKESIATSTWTTYQVNSSFLDVSGLGVDRLYMWTVSSICGGIKSAPNGREFINNSSISNATTTICNGKFTDTGGEIGNYRNNENYTYTIAPAGATSVSLTFSSFNLENNFDFIRFYNGPTTASPQIGPAYTGSTLPPTITATSGTLTIRFTSDSWTTASGWVANWTCVSALPVYGNPILLNNSTIGTLNCGLAYHDFFDSGNSTGNYGNNENNIQTYCNTDTSKAIRLSFRPNPTADQQLSISTTTTGNDYFYIYNGPNTESNLIGVFTGASSASPQPGTFISSKNCLTVKMETDNAFVGNGWIARLYCSNRPSNQGTIRVGGTQGTKVFMDSGGAAGNYANNENYIVTYCPDATAPAGEVVWADFVGNMGIENNWDYFYVFDGANTDARIICAYTGDVSNLNTLGIIKATKENPSGCLTFQFFSDGATSFSGWQANMYTGAARLAYGSDNCLTATGITAIGQTYAGATTIATGRPNNADPSLNISLPALPECSGVNTITRLENSVWYKFSTPNTLCNSTAINVKLNNISCKSKVPGGSGVQFVLYESTSCQNGAGWGTPLYCADKLVNGDAVNIAPYLTINKTYYIMIDGFAGQHCNFDVTMEAINSNNPSSCVLPLDLINFWGTKEKEHINVQWKTANEVDVEGFVVERVSEDGTLFEDISFQTALGNNASKISDYSLKDYNFKRNAVNYYRLRQIDFDGSYTHSKIISIDMRNSGAENSLVVHPNPAKNSISFSLVSDWEGPFELEIYDITGKKVMSSLGTMNRGLWRQNLDLTDLPQGFYAYKLRFGQLAERGKFEKINP